MGHPSVWHDAEFTLFALKHEEGLKCSNRDPEQLQRPVDGPADKRG